MNNRYIRHVSQAIGLFVLATVAGLWPWNTLSGLFSLPQAQYRHALAAFCLLFILRRGLTPGQGAHNRGNGAAGESPDH